jgi:pimeloyl-ACP methyl ester carboxylesterase
LARHLVFVHGANVNSLCWERFVPLFEAAGWTCHAPDWPLLGGEPAALRASVPEDLAGLGVEEILGRYTDFIQGLDSPPALLGHSFGGLFVQLLLSRGIGTAAVALDPAPPAGVFPTAEALKAAWPIVSSFGHWKKAFVMDPREWAEKFANGLPEDQRQAAWERYVVPTPGRLWAQSTWKPRLISVDWKKPDRAPLLICAGGQDHTVSSSMNRSNFDRYATEAVTEFELFPQASHFLLAEPGWEVVAERAQAFLSEHHSGPARAE